MAPAMHQETSAPAVVQQSDYSVAGIHDVQKNVDSNMTLLLSRLSVTETNFVLPVLAEADAVSAGAGQDLPVYKLLAEGKFAEWNRACADFTATNLPVGVGVSEKAKFHGLINGYQGKYVVSELKGQDGKRRRLIKNAARVGSEQLLRRLFEIDGKMVFHAFGGFFLQKIQELPYVVKFWLVLRNIAEVIPRMQAGEDVTINYFAQLFPVYEGGGKNLYVGLQEATQALWGCRFQAEAMDLEQKMRKTDEARLRACMEEVVLAHEYEISLDDFGPSHLLWVSDHLPRMKLKEVKMSADMKAKIVDQSLQGESELFAEWMEKVAKIGDFNRVVLEGSDNCAGVHPGVIFTSETRSNQNIPWHSQLQKYTQDQVEDAHANVLEKIQSALPEKIICIQGGFGVLEKEVDKAFASLCAQLGQNNVAATLGSTAWLTWAKGNKRCSEMGLCMDFDDLESENH